MLIRSISFPFSLCLGLVSHAQAPFTLLHAPVTPGSYWLGCLHTMLRPDGRTLSLASADTILITSRSTTGAAQWDVGVSTPVDSIVVIHGAQLLDDGTVAACGHIGDFMGGLYLHLDTLGHVLAARRYDRKRSTSLSAIDRMPNGHLRLVGNTPRPPYERDGLALEVDINGDLLDARRFSVGGLTQLPLEAIPTLDGGHVVIGQAWQLYLGTPMFKYASAVKLDSIGLVQWAWRIHQGGQRAYPEGLVELASGHLLFWIRVEFSTGSKPMFMKLQADGTVEAMVQLDAGAPSDGYLSSGGSSLRTLCLQEDSTLAMSGFGNITDSLFFLRIDTALTNASLLFQGRLPGEWPEELLALPDGDFLRTAYATSPIGGHGLALAYLSSTGESACGDQPVPVSISAPTLNLHSTFEQDTAVMVVSDVSALFAPAALSYVDQVQCLPTSQEEDHAPDAPWVFPNPSMEQVRIKGNGIEHVELVDATGRIMLSRSFRNEAVVDLDVRALSPGLYSVGVRSNDGWISSKLIKE